MRLCAHHQEKWDQSGGRYPAPSPRVAHALEEARARWASLAEELRAEGIPAPEEAAVGAQFCTVLELLMQGLDMQDWGQVAAATALLQDMERWSREEAEEGEGHVD